MATIALVDDDRNILTSVSMTLEAEGYDVTTYNDGASALIGLTAVLDAAEPGERVLLVSYGSGAGSDAISLQVTQAITGARGRALSTRDYIDRRTEIDYATYARYRGKLIT